ncbi:hypothetical protein THAOC_02995 [Thalassiosira oceanica]|uniref:SAP domain-containing protein n=1 Tax=Thalassiosira oceanica TaxID=159749 RepID=K0TDT6_THAOC|nr:hypothetical protein THAOC_02995 [Thalassiosira oceanica]|eukprot:EJK75284.1 hypothetical protein THAOC_02995 [Thalassiosira oceanica]
MGTRLELVEVGAPPGPLSDWVIAPLRFNEFVGLTTTKGEFVNSPEFSCFGHQWLFRIYPGGDKSSDDGYVAMYLKNRTRESIEVESKFVIKHQNGGGDISRGWPKVARLSPKGTSSDVGVGPARGILNFARRFWQRGDRHVKFEVGGTVESAKGRRKRAKTPTATVYAHHYALRWNAPALADMCKPGDDSPTTITNVRPEIFKHLLYYCYGGKIGKEDLQSDAKDIIDAADRFGIVSLKLEAEACHVDTVELTLDNFIEVVTYADSKNLALLKEHCMDFLSLADKVEAAEKVSFDDMPSRLVKDLLVALARGEKKSCKGGKFGIMRVSELRRLAQERGLDVDG